MSKQMCNVNHPVHVSHPQVVADPQPLYVGPEYHGRPDPVEVDRGLHKLLQALWGKGFETQFSCQGWPHGSDGAKAHGTLGYVLFRTADQAIRFFRESHEMSSAKGWYCPKLILETATGLAEDGSYIDGALPPRGVVRFEHVDLHQLEELWVS